MFSSVSLCLRNVTLSALFSKLHEKLLQNRSWTRTGGNFRHMTLMLLWRSASAVPIGKFERSIVSLGFRTVRTFKNKMSKFSLRERYLRKERKKVCHLLIRISRNSFTTLSKAGREGVLAVAASHGNLSAHKSSLLKADVITDTFL